MMFRLAALAAIASLLGFAAFSLPADEARAAQFTIEVTATGAQEVPPASGTATARARFVFDDVAKTLTFAVTVSGLSPDLVTASHIHRAAPGVNGPIVHNLSLVGFTQVSGTLNLSDADIADLQAGNLYLNVHSKEHPGGFARAQIVLPRPPAPPVALPRTGSGGVAEDRSYAFLGAAALLVLAGGTGSLVMALRREQG